MAYRTRKHVALTLETGSGNSVSVAPCQADPNLTGLEESLVESLPAMSRGTYQEAVEGDDIFPEWDVSIFHEGTLSSAVQAKVYDIIMQAGTFAADVTTDPGGVTWHLKVTMVVTHPGGGVDTFTLPNSRVKLDYNALKEGNVLSISGVAYRTGAAEAVSLVSA